ncbi:hypothetical protein N657DRAFT_655932 [Parathielavia appendiculata]|uniref:Aminoglycoside phosphotransferase domain-containing protein n=1 Tax=Parathielavia appendiculata TaxID=2587402 RepID=A0AAN6TZP9_9PEZI|nr:hypothetical protein N657DRAFT_655932 [Parathielavia appendiculata]
MTGYDLLAEAECLAWETGEYLDFFKGSFNVCFHIGFGEGQPSALIRFAKPSHTLSSRRDEKVSNDIRVIEFSANTPPSQPPTFCCWGLSDKSPAQLGPFIMWTSSKGYAYDQAELILDPAIPSATLDTIYDQLASHLLQISRLTFPSIGAISKEAATQSGPSSQLNTGFPHSHLPTTPFPTATPFLHSLTETHLRHFQSQRNLCQDGQNVRKRFIARRKLQHFLPKCTTQKDDPSPLFNDDLQPTNILINPSTLKITGIIDWEFTNAMPAQFIHDPPWSLLLRGPNVWIDRFGGIAQFLERYVPHVEQFVRSLVRAEAKEHDAAATAARAGEHAVVQGEEERLSTRM